MNPRLRLQRQQTLMAGAEYCDFRYYEAVEAPTAMPAYVPAAG